MAHATRRLSGLSFSALALLGVVACGGSNANTQAQTPATTTTTAGSPAVTDPSAAAPPAEMPVTSAPAAPSGADSPSNLATPLAGSTMSGITHNGPSDQPNTTPIDRTDSTVYSDAQIAEVIDAANNGEIAQAREALTKAKSARVRQMAQHMITDHGQAENKLRSIDSKNHIAPQDSAMSDKIKQNGDQVMLTLKASNGSDFDKAYIDAQVDQHQKVLDQIDHDIPQAQNAALVTYLKDVRTKVAHHLKMAQDIQASLNHP
jgi:putative membrane protein